LAGLHFGIGQDQLRALFGKALCDALADAARTADDQRDLV
jgi:hypothetical protein